MARLRVRVVRGVNLAVRDIRTSDPYVALNLGRQKPKTQVIKKNTNPEWNEDLFLTIDDPTLPVKLGVFDKDTFSKDDPMGDAEFSIQPLLEVVKLNLEGIPSGTVIRKVTPNVQNCLADVSSIYLSDGKVTQDINLRLRNVECGEVELQLQFSMLGAR